MTAKTGRQEFALYILSNISRRNDNQKVKFCNLIEYNMRNIFPEILYSKWGGETGLNPYLKNQN